MIIYSQARSYGCRHNIALELTHTAALRDYKNNKFWQSVMVFFAKYSQYPLHLIPQTVAYISMNKFGYGEILKPSVEFSMKNQTQDTMLKNIQSFEQNIKERANEYMMWSRSDIPEYKQNKWKIEELTSSAEVIYDGVVLKHCVVSYTNFYKAKDCSIWSLSKKNGDFFEKIATIEVNNKKIIRAYGKENSYINKEELNVIAAWAKQASLENYLEKKDRSKEYCYHGAIGYIFMYMPALLFLLWQHISSIDLNTSVLFNLVLMIWLNIPLGYEFSKRVLFENKRTNKLKVIQKLFVFYICVTFLIFTVSNIFHIDYEVGYYYGLIVTGYIFTPLVILFAFASEILLKPFKKKPYPSTISLEKIMSSS